MAVCFEPGTTLGRGDLDIFLTNSVGNPTNAFSITFAIYWVDPVPLAEVLIGGAARTPVNAAVGEYYAAIVVPPTATPGDYHIRWTFQQLASTPAQQVVQEFGVVASGSTTASTLTSAQQDCINKLRILLRDNCVGGEELVELDVAGERMLVRMDALHETLHDLSPSRFDAVGAL